MRVIKKLKNGYIAEVGREENNMFSAINTATNKLVYIDDVYEDNASKFLCPVCSEEVIKKTGSMITHHFAHKSLEDCDTFTHDMSEWHKWWQERFPKGNREHVETLTIPLEEYKWAMRNYDFKTSAHIDFVLKHKKDTEITLKHRADVRACGYVIEFQHSPISREEFNERNWFYTRCGCKVIWIFDMTRYCEDNRMDWTDEIYRYGKTTYKWKWDYASKTFVDFLPQYHKKRKFEDEFQDSDVLLFFQFANYDENESDIGIMEQVIWAIEDEDGCANFKRFMTVSSITTPKEFYDAIITKRI